MKNITESIKSGMVTEGVLRGRLTNNDKKNFKLIADALSSITSTISDWIEDDEDNEYSDTADLGRALSNLASQLEGEWPEEVTFKYY